MSVSDRNKKVIVAMSGGVDSSVAAAILLENGFDVIGITIKTYDYGETGGNVANESSCCSLEGINDAKIVAAKLGIPHYVVDYSSQFKKEVIDNFVDEYLAGRTPNPCVICNKKIKWEELLKKADSLGADFIATGHFAKIKFNRERNRYIIARGSDENKDQSYALWSLDQNLLSRTLFPLGDFEKPAVREIAKKYGLKTASKSESFEICFISDDNYERFLKEQIPDLENRVKGGDLVLDGKIVGKHKGYPFYTIGQRKGLGIAMGEPLYVTQIHAENNSIKLGRENDLKHKALIASQVNLISYARLGEGKKVNAKVRYKDSGSRAFVRQLDDEKIIVEFDEPKRAITPGQSVVFYEGDELVGGAVIDSVID